MKRKLKEPEYYFKVRSAWPKIIYGKAVKKREKEKNRTKVALCSIQSTKRKFLTS